MKGGEYSPPNVTLQQDAAGSAVASMKGGEYSPPNDTSKPVNFSFDIASMKGGEYSPPNPKQSSTSSTSTTRFNEGRGIFPAKPMVTPCS